MNHIYVLLIAFVSLTNPLYSQTGASLRGQVTDESGGVLPKASVTVTRGPYERTALTDAAGNYSFENLPPDVYTVSGATESLVSLPVSVTLTADRIQLNLKLSVRAKEEKITVEDNDAPAVTTESASNASGAVLRGDALDSLSDNPNDSQADLQGLAGPAAGPGGASIYIDSP
jgi:Carboxypeptidase regulatory-like domain